MFKSYLVLIFMLLHQLVSAIDFGRINLAYLYDPSALLRVEHSQELENGVFRLYLDVNSKAALPYALSILTQGDLEEEAHREVGYVVDTIMHGLKKSSYLLEVNADSLDRIVVLRFSNAGEIFYFPTYLDKDLGQSIAFMDEPVGSYLSESPVLNEAEKPYCYAYSMDFGLADPAFGNMRELSPTLEPDSLFLYSSDQTLQDWTFYFLQYDTTRAAGRGFLKVPAHYPKLAKLEELVGPVKYLSSSSEFEGVVNADNPKFAFEQFWIRNAGGKQKARTAISSFYNRVTWSNALFTNYKPGWKTDQGLIFLIFGKPDQVYKTNRKERWMYLDGQEFEFIRISTLFAPTLYTLIRKKEYRDRWIQRIGQIRKGE